MGQLPQNGYNSQCWVRASQEPGIPSWFSTWLVGFQVIGPISTASQAPIQDTKTGASIPFGDADISDNTLPTVPQLLPSFIIFCVTLGELHTLSGH